MLSHAVHAWGQNVSFIHSLQYIHVATIVDIMDLPKHNNNYSLAVHACMHGARVFP